MTNFENKPSPVLGSFSLSILLISLITVAGFGLRLIRLDFQPLWWDEGYSLFFATRDIPTLIERTSVDIHPPLYYILLQLWMMAFGKNEISVRLMSVMIGVAAIPLLYVLARKLFADTRVALMTALLLAISPFHIYYSQEIRMYGLVTLLGLASVYAFVQLLGMPPGKPKTALVAGFYILVTTAALYTQYYAFFLLAFQMTAVIASALRKHRFSIENLKPYAHWLAAWMAIGILYLPWVVYALPRLVQYVTAKIGIERYRALDPISFLSQYLSAFSVGHLTDWTWLAWASLLPVTLGVIGLVAWIGRDAAARALREERNPANQSSSSSRAPISPISLVCLYLGVPFMLAFIVNLVYPFTPTHGERLLLIALPAFCILVAIGLLTLSKRHALLAAAPLAIIVATSTVALADFYTVPRYPNDDYRPLMAQVRTLAQRGDAFLAIYPWQVGYLETEYEGAPLTVIQPPSDAWINNPVQMQNDLDSIVGQHRRLWLPAFQTQGRILENELDTYLGRHHYVVLDSWFGTTRLELFEAANDPFVVDRPLAFRDGGQTLAVSRWGVTSESILAGQGTIHVILESQSVPSGEYKTSLRLKDPRGNLWAQEDREFEKDTIRIGLAVPLGTPPGKYEVKIAAYRSRDAVPLSPVESTDGEVLLGIVQIASPKEPNLTAISHPAPVDYGGLRLVGFDLPEKPLRPGEPSTVTFYWQASQQLPPDLAISVQIQDGNGRVFASSDSSPAHGIYPVSQWQPNELIRDPQTVVLRGDTPDGDYRIVVAPVAPATSQSKPAFVGSLKVKGRPHYYGAPSPNHSFNARFGQIARLVGYDLNIESRNARLALYWHALEANGNSYKVFAHLLDQGGALVSQDDQVPGNGQFPTSSWVKGEYLSDLYEIPLPVGLPGGEYQVEIGFYDPSTGMRLSVYDSSDKEIGDHSVLTMRIP